MGGDFVEEVESQFRGGEAGVFSPDKRLHPTAPSRRLARLLKSATVALGGGTLPEPGGGWARSCSAPKAQAARLTAEGEGVYIADV